MRRAPAHERAVGMAYYVSDADGIGGQLRASPEDFRVRELEAGGFEPLEADPGAYPHLVVRVRLRDWETAAFAGALSDRLGISRERVSWAGTKDKRAVTTQLFSIEGVDPPLPELDDATIEPIGRAGRPVLFGDLAGNAFEIVVRNPEGPERVDRITAALAAFAAGGDDPGASDTDQYRDGTEASSPVEVGVGVANYFGTQRFGSLRAVTHEVGLAIARGDWEQAVLAYLGSPSDREPETTRRARRFVEETRDWTAALERFPDRLGYERAMLHALTDGESFRAALETAPTALQSLFVNAAQSYLFNRMLSDRLEQGLPFAEPVPGDVVCFADRSADTVRPRPDPDRTQQVTEDRLSTIRRHCERGRAFVTAPLVGTETELADGEPGKIERTVLEAAGIEPGDFDLPGAFHSTGTRRAVLVRTDLAIDREPLTFRFRLPSGAYATTLLREYLKK